MGRIGILLLMLLGARAAVAEPYLAVQQGYACSACHFNASGGGLRSAFGTVFAENVLPSIPLPAQSAAWTGQVGELLSVGADLRASATRTGVPNAAAVTDSGVDQLRVYGAAALVQNRVDLYVDEALAPGNARVMEAYLRLRDERSGLYLKGGQFYLPFGWRLQDSTAFVREASGVSMTTADSGVELGYEHPGWSMQLDLTHGVANTGLGSGHQLTGQWVRLQSRYRFGVALLATQSVAGDRRAGALFAGLRTGRIAWLGEFDVIRDAGYPQGTRTLAAALGEADWGFARGHNLKLTAELYDPDRNVANDQKTRFSVVYEWTPLPFVQLRGGLRRYSGIPQNDPDNRRVAFLELHGFF